MKKSMICQVCANHCTICAENTENGITVTGNLCPRGEQYGKEALMGTGSTITCKVATAFADTPTVMVSTTKKIPGELAFKLRRYLKKLKLTQRLPQGGIIEHEPLGIDTDLILASQDMNINI